jgi:hypothetical protein
MSGRTLEQRLAALEREVAELRATVARSTPPTDWRSTIGMFTGDEVMKQVFEEAMKIREAERERARRPTKRRQAKR